MQSVEVDAELVEAAKFQRKLIDRAWHTKCSCPHSVLNLGAAVAAHSRLVARLWERQPFIEDIVSEEISAEHLRLEQNLELLETLSRSDPDSTDIVPLTNALLDRIRALLEREERVLYKPLLRLPTRSEAES